jgi:formamidopyrimidine-DNA glycosylase
MPELIEVEAYRRASEHVVGRHIETVHAPDPWYLKGGLDAGYLAEALLGGMVSRARRVGKLLLLDIRERPTLGLRFGMTGRLIVDGEAAIQRLEYSSARDEPPWDRLRLTFLSGGFVALRDPRRLGGVFLDPDETALGVDALDIDARRLEVLLQGSAVALKARLMDQRKLAGLGNLLTDEILWQAGLSPLRPASSLSVDERARLLEAIGVTVRWLDERGGSHTGELQPSRHPGSTCPACGEPLRRDRVGGRTTYWCPNRQR